jgi:hypothetical protein
MTPQSQIQTLESLGITRYRIACDTGINQKTLCNWLNGKAPMKSNSNVIVLNDYYEKLMQGMQE